MAKEADATFQEVFSQVSSTNSIKLLPWCIFSTVPLCYMSEALAPLHDRKRTSLQLSLYLSWRASRLQTPQTVQFVKLELHLFQCLPFWISPLLVLPLLGTHLLDSLLTTHRKGGTTLLAAPSVINAITGPMKTLKRLRLGANTALHRVMKTHPNWYWRLGTVLNHKGRNLPVPLSVQPRPALILMPVL